MVSWKILIDAVKDSGLSKRQVCDRASISEETYHRFINGYLVSIPTLDKIANSINYKGEILLKYTSNKQTTFKKYR